MGILSAWRYTVKECLKIIFLPEKIRRQNVPEENNVINFPTRPFLINNQDTHDQVSD